MIQQTEYNDPPSLNNRVTIIKKDLREFFDFLDMYGDYSQRLRYSDLEHYKDFLNSTGMSKEHVEQKLTLLRRLLFK